MPATKSLPEAAHDAIEHAIETAADDEPVVLWWDDGGHLEELVRTTSADIGCRFRAAEASPLELRADAPSERTVWYVPEERSEDTDWFRDVEATGGVIEQHIGKLAARCFEQDRLQAASIRTAYEDAEDPDDVARTLYHALDGEGGLPDLRTLQTRIVLDDQEDAVAFVLEHGVEQFPTDQEDRLTIRDLLVERGVTPVEGETDPERIVERTRQWAVAEWLVDAGLDPTRLPEEYRPDTDTGLGMSRPELQSVLSKTERAATLAAVYLDPDRRYWDDVLRDIEDPWTFAECPVGAGLEHRLWDTWEDAYRSGDYEQCAERARTRRDRLETTYGDVPWTEVWAQAVEIADLAAELDAWTERGDTADVVSLYGDQADGTWRIDNAVFSLVVSGTPEDDLPEEHLAKGSLDAFREGLIEEHYLEYLRELGELSAEQIESGAPFVDERHAHQFFHEEGEHLQSGESVVLFVIDALRFDLAHELAERIRRDRPGLEIEEETWVGTLPSDTKFGKGALTPGGRFGFSVRFEDDDLIPTRNGEEITNYQRRQLLENDGWSYITRDGDEVGWSNTRVVYYWNDIDTAGEGGLTNFEEVFEDRLETIAAQIRRKLDQGEWDRAYILTDHGFVSLPQRVDINDLDPPSGTQRITRRWIAGPDVDEDAPGVLLDASTQLGYLEEGTKVSILADPIQRFSNQGLPDARFYHGGILPQEFVLNFVTITQE